jgi:lia operon protein LiaF
VRNRGQIIVGLVLVGLGLFILLGRVLRVDLSAYCWPVGLILLGVFVLSRPYIVSPGTEFTFRPLADIRRRDRWPVQDEEIWVGVGDVTLDLTATEVPEGETTIRVFGLVGDVDLVVPQRLAAQVSCTAFVADVRAPGRKQDVFFSTWQWSTEDYELADRQVNLELVMFVTDLDVRVEPD